MYCKKIRKKNGKNGSILLLCILLTTGFTLFCLQAWHLSTLLTEYANNLEITIKHECAQEALLEYALALLQTQKIILTPKQPFFQLTLPAWPEALEKPTGMHATLSYKLIHELIHVKTTLYDHRQPVMSGSCICTIEDDRLMVTHWNCTHA